jgi:hypothetical protein
MRSCMIIRGLRPKSADPGTRGYPQAAEGNEEVRLGYGSRGARLPPP